MTDKLMNVFCSKEYDFLNWLKGQERQTSYGMVINFSQEEIAVECGSSPATVNKWLQALQSVNCVEQKKRGSYHVTNTGNKVIAKMKEIEKLVGGNKDGH